MASIARLFHLLPFLCLLISPAGIAQNIAHGPVFGAVTESSAKMYLRPRWPAHVEVILSHDASFSQKTQRFTHSQWSPVDTSGILMLKGLQAGTRYYYRIMVDGVQDSIDGHFKTFPEAGATAPGGTSFVTGSCQETENMKVFDVIRKLDPLFLLHTGDFTYPDYQIRPDYSNNYRTVAFSYHKRYQEKRMQYMLRYIPVDYIYDDNDYVGSSGGRFCKNDHSSDFDHPSGVRHRFKCDTFPPHWRRNVIKGYTEFFPHYPLPDTSEGLYHSYRIQNFEFFFLDRCSARPVPVSHSFKYIPVLDLWRFKPDEERVLYGKKQMDWLKERLLNSTADWKFIVSGVPFNQALRKVIRAGMVIQKFRAKGYNGFHLATGLSHYWAGHPAEQEDFMDWLAQSGVRDVLMISGDTHHNVMDDGRNAGLPELNASGMSVTGTVLAYYLNLVGRASGMFNYHKHVWNQGGNGLGNKNFKNAFGLVTVHGKDYVDMAIVDEDADTVSSMRIFHSSHPEYLDLFSGKQKRK